MSEHAVDAGRTSGLATTLPRRRQVYGIVVAVVIPPLLTAVLLQGHPRPGLDTALLLLVLASVGASAVGGILPGVLATVVSGGLANFFFTVPYGTFNVASAAEAVDLVIFLAVSLLVGFTTEATARDRARAEHHRIEATWVAEVGTRAPDRDSVERILTEALGVYEMHSASLLKDSQVLARIGEEMPGDAPVVLSAGEGLTLRLVGPEHFGDDRRLLGSWALAVGQLWRTRALAQQARRAEELARIDELRASLLAAVGHDLRNPLAAVTVAASTLRQTDIELSPEDREELLATIVEHAGRLNDLIANLLDMSRIQAGALSVHPEPTVLLEVLRGVVRRGAGRLELDIPDALPLVVADAGLLERVIANLVDNADRHVGTGEQVLVRAFATESNVVVEVVDHGPGVAPERMEEIFAPFQHFGDRSTTGVGLGLAIARGFTEAMGGTLAASATPGGGLTMTITLEVARAAAAHR
ncbi:MAG TPA: ATP-binding protein [Propionibacteriaceae bacterium]|nr:ATP-binding protein [Propionibacteriaceae bacterium]